MDASSDSRQANLYMCDLNNLIRHLRHSNASTHVMSMVASTRKSSSRNLRPHSSRLLDPKILGRMYTIWHLSSEAICKAPDQVT